MSNPRVAYFCMEYGLHEELPMYAGGLGILAGDHIKSAHDRGLPLVAIGLFWREGYTQQRIGGDGYPYDDFPAVSMEGFEDAGVRFHVSVQGNQVECRALRSERYGTAPLYLIESVEDRFRWITRRLYGGRHHDRIAQEILLGVGGVRLLRALGHQVDVYHFNEGHAVFAGLELIRERIGRGLSFDEALADTRDEIVFTTHTPVPAGNESHDLGVLHEMGAWLDFNQGEMERLGGNPFNMTVAGLRLCRQANAVAKLHAETSREMWKHVSGAAPIVAITNGVHPGTWQDARIRAAFEADDPAGLWNAHQEAKRELCADVKSRAGVELDPGRAIIGFARRAASYKRSDLILRDPSRIEPLLERREVQLLFSGKAHPQDEIGKRIVANLARLARQYPSSVVFIENYDMAIGRALTRGCDLWLNNPIRPFEASGTSGMKAAMNGVLNFSVLDGWWPEGCEHGVNGWQIGDAYEGEDRDEHDLRSLFEVLTGQILPTYYGDHERWIRMMRASIEMSRWRFSSDRMLEEYYEKLYSPKKRLRAVS
ncbi:alpha-glucan family phosphorylase [Vulgatibacter incomptus]|uniref:glycogen phosphorylase n=1 Tax=Vulgatibacter incomptus TaxID=1391653 RepID=A0A0K1P869_9BACT|nr:alpha-glucan family phosphorylase [Vulgatibacter incomptus]AKU89718.1 Glycogen phosphorylase [Vulgatibacter incomptus]